MGGTETGLQCGRPKYIDSVSQRLRRYRLKPRCEMERAAPTFLALHPDASVHHLDQTAGDGQTETGAAKSSGERAVYLGECIEDQRLFFGWNPDSCIAHGEVQRLPFLGRPFDRDRDAAPLGELDGVANEIDQNLPQPSRIA